MQGACPSVIRDIKHLTRDRHKVFPIRKSRKFDDIVALEQLELKTPSVSVASITF